LGWRQRLQFAVVGRGIFLLLFQSWVIGSCYSFVYQTVCLLLSDLQFCVMGENKTKRLVPRVVAETQTRLLLREAAPKCADRFPSHGNICYGGYTDWVSSQQFYDLHGLQNILAFLFYGRRRSDMIYNLVPEDD
jgi:hypothetical protein